MKIKVSKKIIVNSKYDLDKLRESIGCNVTEFATVLGMDKAQISKIAKGKVAISDKLLFRIVKDVEDYKEGIRQGDF